MKTVTDFSVLMKLAYAMGKAEQNGNEEEYIKAKEVHDAYRDLCLKADKMIVGYNFDIN
ncbi:MAG: hypothetical protein RBT49_06420 [Bacteroidales bacterium]|jgi:hypothetical protein|nr:hypothetical protein [Bacteroidales bacterium]